jgi:Anti-sigma factor NepR
MGVQDISACMAAIIQAIGQRLRQQYDVHAQPMPERLTVLLRQLAQKEEPARALTGVI